MSEPLLLMTSGPTRVPDRALQAGARPMIHHRTPEFSSELAAAIELLGPVFGTRSLVLPVHTGESHVADEHLDPAPATNIPTFLLKDCDVPELAPGGTACLDLAQPSRMNRSVAC